MRSKIEANEYKDYILGFIFYKYLSEKQVQYCKAEGMADETLRALSEENTDAVKYIMQNKGYFIAYDDLFSTWVEMGSDFDVSNVRDALSAFSRLISPAHKKLFDGIFDTLQTGLSKLGDSAAKQTKAISDLIHLIKDIPMDGKQGYDVLGFIYEYLIGQFAANAGKKAGEFYTPNEVSVLLSEIVSDHLRDRDEIQIYDSCSGSGSLLINIGKSITKHVDHKDNIKYYAQELKKNTYNLTRMNLVMRGIIPSNIETRNGDTLEDDWPYFDESDRVNTYSTLYVDAVVSNPPYSQKWDPAHKDSDPRYARFGMAPKSKADFAFLLHDLYHLKPDGIMTIVLPHGVLFRGGQEGVIRQRLIEANHIDAIIGMPAGIFFGTGIPTVVLVLKQKRTTTDLLVVDASKGYVKEGKNNRLRASDIRRIADIVRDRETVPKFSKVVTREQLRKNEYNLNIPRYVDSSEPAEEWDIYASMFGGIPTSELDDLADYWAAFPGLRETLFTPVSAVNNTLAVTDLRAAIMEQESVQAFVEQFGQQFGDFDTYLADRLLTHMDTVHIVRDKEALGHELFRRLAPLPLLDKYEAYQVLDDEWDTIKVDLEVIQTESFASTTVVDPHMVLKKKSGKEVEVQEGWLGRILPFDLVQQTYLTDEVEAIADQHNRLAEIAATYEEVLESLDEDDKEQDTVNEAKDGWVNAAVAREAKAIKKDIAKDGDVEPDTYEAYILQVDELITEEKKLKKQVKAADADLHLLTKATIEALTDEQVYALLHLKWIAPIQTQLHHLPIRIIDELTARVTAIADKYSTTYADVAQQISEAERSLSALIDDLDGNEYDMKGLKEFKALMDG
jgi:type I restriction enzyme M protein